MSALALPVVLQLIGACAPAVAPSTMASVLQTESGFDPWTLHVNGVGGGDLHPATKDEAIEQAIELIVVQRKSVDLGLGQINSANLASLGLTVADALDPCKNLTASAKILTAGYLAGSRSRPDPQRALRSALSQYNTGDPVRGMANGYVGKVERSAGYVVPAISALAGAPEASSPSATAEVTAQRAPPPPSWDAFGLAQTHPASVFVLPASPIAPVAGSTVFPGSIVPSPGRPAPADQAQASAAAGSPAPVVLHAAK